MKADLAETFTFGAFDPRARLVGVLGILFSLALLKSWVVAIVMLGLGVLLWAREPVRPGIKARALTVNAFLAILWVLTPLTTPGHVLFGWGPVTVTETGVALVALLTLKCNAIFFWFEALTTAMRPTDFARAMTGLKVPNKLTSLFLLTARQIDAFERTRVSLEEAAKLRGFEPKLNRLTYVTRAHMVGILLMRAERESRRLNEALRLRAFSGTWPTVHFHRLRPKDWGLIVGLTGLALTVVVTGVLFPVGL